MSAFELRGWPPTAPLLGHVPHSGLVIPPDVRPTLRLNDADLNDEMMAVTDHLTDSLYAPITDLGGALFVNNLSRLVFDPERFRSDGDEYMAALGAGAVYRKTSDGHDLRPVDFTGDDREQVLVRYFDPYASAMEEAVTELLARFRKCTIIDCHSFPKVPLGWEPDPKAHRPRICIGTDDFHTPADLIDALIRKAGDDVLVNVPFKGAYTPQRFWNKDARVTSVMIEIRRDTYCDESTGSPTVRFLEVQHQVAALVKATMQTGATERAKDHQDASGFNRGSFTGPR